MGDILHALPAVTALRQAHPFWEIDWVVEPRWRALLAAEGSQQRGYVAPRAAPNAAQPVVDRVHLAATKEWRKEPLGRQTRAAVSALRHALRDGQYDVILDLQGNLRSAVVGSFATGRRIGEAEPREKIATWFYHDRILTSGAHVIEQDVELAESIAGDLLEPVQPWLPVDVEAAAWAEALLPANGRPAVLLNPGAGWGAKRWPVERYAEVARALHAKGWRVVVNAGPGEESLAEPIVLATGGAALVVVGSLARLIELTRRVDLAIAGDTGPLHLACALRKPVVGIYGPTDPSRNGPFGTRFRVLRSAESKRDHTRRADPEAGLLTIQSADVMRAVDEVLYAVGNPSQETRNAE